MAEVLVVEDSPEHAVLATALLESAGHTVLVAEDGATAFERITTTRPDIVVTDLVMPGMDGLELVGRVRDRYPNLPVILATAHGSGDVAAQALKRGAAHYVPKARLTEDLLPTMDRLLALASKTRRNKRLVDSLVEASFRFRLPNDENLIAGLVDFLQDSICYQHPRCDENVLMQIGVAVQEAIRNAMHHGNLEVSSELRRESTKAYDAKVDERLADPAYASRCVVVDAVCEGTSFRCAVADEGPGFDPQSVPDPTQPANLLKASGRGLYLITMFMDTVEFNDSGSRITMAKDLTGAGETG